MRGVEQDARHARGSRDGPRRGVEPGVVDARDPQPLGGALRELARLVGRAHDQQPGADPRLADVGWASSRHGAPTARSVARPTLRQNLDERRSARVGRSARASRGPSARRRSRRRRARAAARRATASAPTPAATTATVSASSGRVRGAPEPDGLGQLVEHGRIRDVAPVAPERAVDGLAERGALRSRRRAARPPSASSPLAVFGLPGRHGDVDLRRPRLHRLDLLGQLGGDLGVVARHRHRQVRLVLDPAPGDLVARRRAAPGAARSRSRTGSSDR